MGEHLPTARACAMTEAMRAACACSGGQEASAELDRVPSWIMHPSVAEMKKVAMTVRKEREGVLNWFTSRSTNAFLEGVNSVVQSIKRAARGFRNLGGLRDDGVPQAGGLDFSTQTSRLCATH